MKCAKSRKAKKSFNSSGSLGTVPGCLSAKVLTIRGEAEPTWCTCSSALGRPAMKADRSRAVCAVTLAVCQRPGAQPKTSAVDVCQRGMPPRARLDDLTIPGRGVGAVREPGRSVIGVEHPVPCLEIVITPHRVRVNGRTQGEQVGLCLLGEVPARRHVRGTRQHLGPPAATPPTIGRASCRERVCQYV